MKPLRIWVTWGVALGAVAMMAAGCGCREKAANKVAEKAIEKAIESQAKKDGKDVKVNMDLKKGAMSIQSKDGSQSTDVSMTDGQVSVKSQDGETKVDSDGQTMTMKTPEGTVTSVSGKNAKVPDTFPKDVPIYPGAAVQSAMTLSQQETFHVQAETADALDKVAAYYKKELTANGWTEEQVMSTSGDSPMQMLNYSKDGRHVMVMATTENGKSLISVQTSKD